jgi:hypothetical protein
LRASIIDELEAISNESIEGTSNKNCSLVGGLKRLNIS